MTGFPSALLLAAAVFHPHIPRTWEDASVATLEVPLANPKFSPIHISEAEYYRLPERTIYKSYPVYHPDRSRQAIWNGSKAGSLKSPSIQMA